MGIFEGITHSEEIQSLLNDAQKQYDKAKNKLESQKNTTAKSLELLGEIKVKAWSEDMNRFLNSFGSFSHVEMVCRVDESYDFLGTSETPNELMINMRNATYNADEIVKIGALAMGTGALVGIATYGGVAMFAKASTGTAITSLRGIAKKNATLAWLGGGSIATGGAGIAGGTVVLGGVVIGTILLVGGLIAGAEGKAKLAEAKRIHAESESAVSKMNVVITSMAGIEKVSDNYRDFISNLSGLFTPYLDELDSIACKYQRGSDGKVDFNSLSEMEQKTLHLSWLLAQLYYHILSVPLLNDQGEINALSRQLLKKAQKDYAELSGQVNELENEKKKIHDLLADARKSFYRASDAFYKKKVSTRDLLADIGKKRIDLWEESFLPFIGELGHFENISVENTYPYNVTDIPIEFVFESGDMVISYIKRLRNKGIDSLGKTGLVEVALFGGEDFLGELSQLHNVSDAVGQVHRHDMSLWFTDELDPGISDNILFGEVSDYYINDVKQTVNGISGRENLAQASAINREVKELSNKINRAMSDFDNTTDKIRILEKTLKKYNSVQALCIRKMEEIRRTHKSSDVQRYDCLSKAERRVFEMSFVIAKMQYAILASCILTQSNGGDEDDVGTVVDVVNSTYRRLKKDTFMMNEKVDLKAADIFWKDDADRMMLVGYAISALCMVLLVAQLVTRNIIGFIGVGGAIIAFPTLFYDRSLPQSRLLLWRCIRIVLAIFLVVIAEIVGLVV